MTKNNKSALAVAVGATLGGVSTAAHAANFNVSLTGAGTYSNGGFLMGNVTSSTATFSYDDVTTVLMQTGGTVNARFNTSPTNTIFRHLITGVVIGNGATTTASTYVCAEGNFGGNVGANICGNYGLGGNFTDDSTASWGPGTAFDRTLGGDDTAYGLQQNIAAYDGFNTVSWNGTTLVIGNGRCTIGAPSCAGPQSWNTGLQWTLQVIPIPPSVWLFGSALGVMGWMRRKAAAVT